MAPKDSNDCVVTVTIEMGHQANFLKEPSPEGFTHDWTVFVRGFEGSRLEYFVEKVVFKLHKTFKSPVRVITEPPFRVTESGYAGFILPIEIHFKNKQTPRKIVFSYDLFLNAKDSPPINNVRYEKLKFQNPTPEFKAKLIKAGGVEQGPEHPSGDHFGSPVRSEKRALPKIPKDKEKDKEKIKKKKKSSPQFKPASPAPSLSSLSPMSSDNEDSYTAPPPPPPVKKDKELSVKRESSSSAPHSKQDSSSSHKDKSKHRSSSSNSSHKERSDKGASHKSHQHKDKTKERERSSSHKDKESVKKERDSNSQKVVKEHFESRKEREGSHSSGKSSTSSQLENKVAVQPSQKDREKALQSRDKDTLISSKEKLHSSSKDREKISKEKHSSHRDVSHTSHSEPKKVKEEVSKEKTSKESDRHHKSHKRHMESADDVEKKKLKRSSSVVSIDEKSVKVKSSSEKDKHVSRDNKEKESSKEVKESKSSSSDKSKHEKSRHSEKQRHSHSSETKQKESAKRSEVPQKLEKVIKPEILTHSERLAMTADFQPQLLLSPIKSKSDEEESPTPSPLVEKVELKSSTSHSSPSSAVSGEDKSDHEILDTQADEDKHIVSGLTDSDSDSEEDVPYVKSQQKDLKSILNKQSQQTTQVNKLEKVVKRSPADEKQKKVEHETTEDGARKKAEKKANITEPTKLKSVDRKIENSDADVEQVTAANNTDNQNCNGLDILAPNGMSIGELIAINEQIEKAQTDLNQELLERVIHVIGETDDFDITDVSLSFDICSVDKTVVLQIQNLLREYQLQCCS